MSRFEIFSNAAKLTPALFLSSAVFLTDQYFAAQISTNALLVVSMTFYLPLIGLTLGRSIGPAFNIIFNKSSDTSDDWRTRLKTSPWFKSANTLVLMTSLLLVMIFLFISTEFSSIFSIDQIPGQKEFYLISAVSVFFTVCNTFCTFVLIANKQTSAVLNQNALVFSLNLIGNYLALYLFNLPEHQLIGIGVSTLLSQCLLFLYQRIFVLPASIAFSFSHPSAFFKRGINVFGWDLINGYIGLAFPVGLSVLVLKWSGTDAVNALSVGGRIDHFLSVGAIASLNYGCTLLSQHHQQPEKFSRIIASILSSSLIIAGIPFLLVLAFGAWFLPLTFGIEGQQSLILCLFAMSFGIEYIMTSGLRALLRTLEKTRTLMLIEQSTAGLLLFGLVFVFWKTNTPIIIGIPVSFAVASLASGLSVYWFGRKHLSSGVS